ncbi:hypothetical protein [uncultured Vibrio sp.]|uniref:hypothetical protein n=1 Tax=uncultured Vibrio sp. TaxID=114054 RepID=UPI002619EEE5|nr:hypothetical protein [uncultured Vibrio sp.]
MDRRKFLTGAAGVGLGLGTAAYASIFTRALTFSKNGAPVQFHYYGNSDPVEWRLAQSGHQVAPDYAIKHSTCLQCHSECGIRCKVNLKTGKLERIQGNPYHPNTMIDYTPIETPISQTARRLVRCVHVVMLAYKRCMMNTASQHQ